MDKRSFLLTAIASLVASATPMRLLALTDAQATKLVNNAVADINKIIQSGKSDSAVVRDFERMFGKYADLNLIARSTLGRDANRASSSQFSAYKTAFRGYMARKYGQRFRDFIGGEIEVKTVKKVKSYHQVKTIVRLKGRSPTTVLFLVSDRSGRDLFFDIVIEGISLRLTERTEIGSLLDRNKGNINAMIADLRKAG